MSDELRAAAKRVITAKWGKSRDDAVDVADAYLAEHPAGDDEQVSYDEVEDALRDDQVLVSTWDGMPSVRIDITITTKRQLRLLLELLGEVQE